MAIKFGAVKHLYCHLSSFPWVQVFRLFVWMANFKHQTPKGTLLVSNSATIASLGKKGKLRRGRKPGAVKAAVKYVDGSGKLRYKGTKELKATQFPECFLTSFF